MNFFSDKTKLIALMSSAIFVFSILLFAPFATQASRLWGDFTPTAYVFLAIIFKTGETTPIPPTATPSPTPTPTNTPSSSPVDYVNMYRAMAGLPLVTENTNWSYGNWLHARYMVKNDVIEHDEDPGNPWFTPEGRAAAQSSNLIVSSSSTYRDEAAIDGWMVAPFHGIGILDPALSAVGYGSYREADGGWQTGAGLDVIRGLGTIPAGVTFPIVWPGNGQTVELTTFPGYEFPDPLTTCPGYSAPAGLPIYLQIGDGSGIPNVTSSSFLQGGNPLEHCIFDETNYTNPNPSYQNLARSILNGRDAIILIPRQPLTFGQGYTVSITVNGETHTWSFTIATLTKPVSEYDWIIK